LCLPLLTLVLFRISEEEYIKAIKEEIRSVVELQEELDIDVLVHGEPEVSFNHLL
jgi:methionine synthase II (cobalamin-independent)